MSVHQMTSRCREAFQRAHREEKVALLGLFVVLLFITWP